MALENPRIGLLIHSIQDKAIQFLRDWGCDHGFGVAIKRSIKDRHGIVYTVNLRCDKDRKFTSTATKRTPVHA